MYDDVLGLAYPLAPFCLFYTAHDLSGVDVSELCLEGKDEREARKALGIVCTAELRSSYPSPASVAAIENFISACL